MKARFLTSLMTSATLLAGTFAHAQKNPDARLLSDKKKENKEWVMLCLYGVHTPQNYGSSKLLQERYETISYLNKNMAYIPEGNGAQPLTVESITDAARAASRSFRNAGTVDMMIDFTGGVKMETRNDTTFVTSRAYLNDINDGSKVLSDQEVFGAVAEGLNDPTRDAPQLVNLLIMSQTGMFDAKAIGDNMPPGSTVVVVNAVKAPLYPSQNKVDNYYRPSQSIMNPEAFLESEIQLIGVDDAGKPLDDDRDVLAFFVSHEQDGKGHKVYAYSLRDMVANYQANMDKMTNARDLEFMHPSVRLSLERSITHAIRKGEKMDAYLELGAMSFMLEALHQNENYRLFNQTAEELYKKQLMAMPSTRTLALEQN